MLTTMSDYWWLAALRGIAALVLGVAAWLWPEQTLIPLVILFGLFALIDGALSVAVSFLLAQDAQYRWLPLLFGIVGALLGIVIILGSDVAEIGLTYVIAIWAIVIGGFNILTALAMVGEFPGAWPLTFMGVISALFGVAVGVSPDIRAPTLAGLIGTFAVLYGVLALVLAYRLRDVPPGGEATSRAK